MELCLCVWSHNGPLNGWYDDDNFLYRPNGYSGVGHSNRLSMGLKPITLEMED